MAGKPKTRTRRRAASRALAKTEPEDVTKQQYQQGWELYRTGTIPRQICQVVGLTARQLHWLANTGNRAKGMAPYEERMVAEIMALRSHEIDCAKETSARTPEVLRRAMINASSATMLVNAIFRNTIEAIASNEALPPGDRKRLEDLVPRGPVLEALKALRPYCDLTSIATTYRLIYGSAPNARAKPAADMSVGDLGQPVLPAAIALMEEHQAATGGSPLIEALMREMADWTTEQKLHYAETGEEPTPQEVIDARARTTTH